MPWRFCEISLKLIADKKALRFPSHLYAEVVLSTLHKVISAFASGDVIQAGYEISSSAMTKKKIYGTKQNVLCPLSKIWRVKSLFYLLFHCSEQEHILLWKKGYWTMFTKCIVQYLCASELCTNRINLRKCTSVLKKHSQPETSS